MLHLWLGLLSSIVLFVVCLSGSIYAFRQQIEDLINYPVVFVDSLPTHQVDIDQMLSDFESRYGTATQVRFSPHTARSIEISNRNRESFGVTAGYDPATGSLLGEYSRVAVSFFAWILELHRFLLAGDVGKMINGIAVLILLLMLMSGFVLWMPKKWKKLKSRLRVRWRARFYRLNYDLHSVVGFYALLLLMHLAVTGLYVSFTWMKNAMIVSLGGDSIVISEENEALSKSLSNAFAETMLQLEEEQSETDTSIWTMASIIHQTDSVLGYQGETRITLPNENTKEIRVIRWRRDNALHFYVPDRLEFGLGGSIRKVEYFYTLPLHEQFKRIARPLHTGEIMGWSSILVFFVVSTIGCSLPVTGFIIWWKRK